MLQPAFLPFRAAVTIALVPIIMKTLGIKKGGSKKPKEAEAQQKAPEAQKPQKSPYDSLMLNFQTGDKGVFNSFAEVNKNENK